GHVRGTNSQCGSKVIQRLKISAALRAKNAKKIRGLEMVGHCSQNCCVKRFRLLQPAVLMELNCLLEHARQVGVAHALFSFTLYTPSHFHAPIISALSIPTKVKSIGKRAPLCSLPERVTLYLTF